MRMKSQIRFGSIQGWSGHAATVLTATLGAAAMLACSPAKDTDQSAAAGDHPSTRVRTASTLASRTSAPTVLFVGTSLTAGYGLQPDQAYPVLVEHLADSAGVPIRAINAGVSGETSAGALARIDWVLKQPANVIVIETGANDALRALPVSQARANIAAILRKARHDRPQAQLVLVQMEAPPNLGADYTSAFHAMYGELAREYGATLAPFLLDGVAGIPDLNQGDGVHPNAAGERIVARNVWRALEPVVKESRGAPAA
jgi:acyl-CoA thioesterase-1